jgi:hypothetical protein
VRHNIALLGNCRTGALSAEHAPRPEYPLQLATVLIVTRHSRRRFARPDSIAHFFDSCVPFFGACNDSLYFFLQLGNRRIEILSLLREGGGGLSTVALQNERLTEAWLQESVQRFGAISR